jgi:hypothetical protein
MSVNGNNSHAKKSNELYYDCYCTSGDNAFRSVVSKDGFSCGS